MIYRLKQGRVILATVFAFLFFGSLVGLFLGMLQPSLVAGSSTVTVSATVSNSISCSVSTTTTTFGTLTPGAVAVSSPNVSSTMSCANDAAGCTLSISDAGNGSNGGLYSTSTTTLIPSPDAAFDATSTLIAGTEGFGIQATTTSAGSGATFTVGSDYVYTGNTVGKITTSTMTLVSTNAPSSGRSVIVTHSAAISASTPGGNYSDTITYGCTAN